MSEQEYMINEARSQWIVEGNYAERVLDALEHGSIELVKALLVSSIETKNAVERRERE